uniref:LAM_G_DOMAIN domain-containing protein n=1 Tax=Parastrongyloides trichosuri TaxID=131310 RepID=A0A0N4ZRM3_PARTI
MKVFLCKQLPKIIHISVIFLLLWRCSIIKGERYQQKRDTDDFRTSFNDWIQEVHSNNKDLIDHSKMAEGEVLLFKTRKFRHRAIPIMKNSSYPDHLKFNDALTFKEWLREMSPLGKALKVTLKNTEVVKPVLQHLYATNHLIKSPIILHANVFRSQRSLEKPVDSFTLLEYAHKFLPNAAVSLGWTKQDENVERNNLHNNKNHLDWGHTFKILSYLNSIDYQPLILTIRLTDALISSEQLSFLLGQNRPFYVIIYSKPNDDIHDINAFKIFLNYARKDGKVIFDLAPKHRKLVNELNDKPIEITVKKEDWRVINHPSPYGLNSQVVASDRGIAFIGETSSFVVLNKTNFDQSYPNKQKIRGKVHFLPKKFPKSDDIDETGMEIVLLDNPHKSPGKISLSGSSKLRSSVTIFIGVDGDVSISNSPKSKKIYDGSAVGKVPKVRCYAFELIDKGWRVDLAVWTEDCHTSEEKNTLEKNKMYETFIQLETPVSKSRKLRSVIIGKRGGEDVDFILEKASYNGAAIFTANIFTYVLMILIFLHLTFF